MKFRQYWSEGEAPGESGWWEGVILNKKPGHGQLCVVKYQNDSEMAIMKSEEQTFRGNIIATSLPDWKVATDIVAPAFEYVEKRLTNDCDACYHMKDQHEQMKLLQVEPTVSNLSDADCTYN